MKAILFDDFGEAEMLHLGDAPDPEVRPHDLLVRVHAAGVNRADISQRRGAYGRPDFGDSSLMGLEIAGEVIGIGADASGYRLGDRVMGIVGGGAYATLARIDYRMAMPIPAGLDYVQAAAIPEVFVTANEALIHLAELRKGQTVLIHAASGGVGTAAVQLAHLLGARIFGTARSDKHDDLRALGVELCIDFETEDFAEIVERTTEGKGVDVVIDFIGAPYLARNVRCLAEGGRLIQVGIMGGVADATVPLDRILFRHLRIIGTVMKSRPQEVKQAMVSRFRERWLDRFTDGSLKPIVDCALPLARAADAHRRMETGQAFGKIVLVP
jgi:putative PIG3 family NAD(P)H quinone oxidoreductase